MASPQQLLPVLRLEDYGLCTRFEYDQLRQPSLRCDKVIVKGLAIETAILDTWGRIKPQPVQLSLTCCLRGPFESAAQDDKVTASTVHYGNLAKALRKNCANAGGQQVHDLIETAWRTAIQLAAPDALEAIEVEVRLPKGLRRGTGIVLRACLLVSAKVRTCGCRYEGLRFTTIIGVNANERERRQLVELSLEYDGLHVKDPRFDLEDAYAREIENSSFETLESLAYQLSSTVNRSLEGQKKASYTLRLQKPSAIPFAEAAAVEITRGGGNSWGT